MKRNYIRNLLVEAFNFVTDTFMVSQSIPLTQQACIWLLILKKDGLQKKLLRFYHIFSQ